MLTLDLPPFLSQSTALALQEFLNILFSLESHIFGVHFPQLTSLIHSQPSKFNSRNFFGFTSFITLILIILALFMLFVLVTNVVTFLLSTVMPPNPSCHCNFSYLNLWVPEIFSGMPSVQCLLHHIVHLFYVTTSSPTVL